jgi:hypothetical protein
MKRSILLVGLAAFAGPVIVVACGPSEPEAKTPPPAPSVTETTPPPPAASTPETTTSASATPPPPAKDPAVVEDMTPSPDPTPAPTVKIVAPATELSIGDAAKAKDYVVRLDVKNWSLAEDGDHVHLILDSYPYKKIFDLKTPIKLGELLPPGAELTEGQHVLHAFPSRATHESVKSKGAAAMATFWVGKKGKPAYDYKKPHLVYSRPKGNYGGAMAKEVLIDFYLMGTTLEKGDKVHYTITGPGLDQPLAGDFTKWAPKVVKNLGQGEFEFKLEYQDKDGKPIEGPLNSVARKVKLDPTAPADPHGGMTPHTMGSSAPAGTASVMPPAASASASAKKSK